MFSFMDPATYEQYSILKQTTGSIDRFLKEGTKVTVELIGEEAVALQFPKVVELKVTLTAPGIRGGAGQYDEIGHARKRNGDSRAAIRGNRRGRTGGHRDRQICQASSNQENLNLFCTSPHDDKDAVVMITKVEPCSY